MTPQEFADACLPPSNYSRDEWRARRLAIAKLVTARDPAVKEEALRAHAARVAELERALAWAHPEACAMLCPSVGKAGVPIPHLPECMSAAAALKEVRR